MKSPRKILVLILIALSIAAVVLVQTFNIVASRHLESVQQELQKLLGKEVRFASLEVQVLGWPGFVAKELRIADDPHFAATPIIRARELILGVRLWPLLFGHVVIDSLTFSEPELQIIADETGLLNLDLLTQRRKDFTPLPKLRAAPTERRQSNITFSVEALRIDDGRVIYLDRSVKEPAELQLRDIDMKLRGLDSTKATRLRFAAALVEGLGQDVHIEGQFDAAGPEQTWQRREMNLTIQLDSLHVPIVARAIAALRDKIPRELEVTGPMSLQAKASGTLARPRFENITLKAPLFGSSNYNATITGDIEFSERRSWEDARLQGTLAIDPLSMTGLRNLNWFRQRLSPALVTEGGISVYSRFEGTWDTLRVGVLVRADKSEWRYKDMLRKRLDRPAEMKLRIARQKNKFFFHESELASGPNRVGFNGFVDTGDEPKLQLRLYNSKGLVTEWGELLAPAALVAVAGRTDLNIVIDRQAAVGNDSWSVYGNLKLIDGEFKIAESGGKIDSANATIVFNGQQARFENLKFRLGTSTFTLDGVAPNILSPNAAYQLRSTQLNLADLPTLHAGPNGQLKNFSAKGAAQFRNGALVVDGNVLSFEGRFGEFDFRDLRSEIAWSATGLVFKNLSLRTLDGVIRAHGYLASASDNTGRVELSVQADGLEMRALMTQLIPPIKGKFEGQLNGRGQFALATTNGGEAYNELKGSGEITVQRGAIKDFNLVSQLLLRGSGTTVSAQSTARLSPGFANLLTRPDTIFDSLKADFIVEPERIRSDNLVIATADYTITGAGWIGFDRTTKWNGLIVLSPRVTQEVQRDYRLVRYLLDRRGRLAITFRVEGTIPNARIRLDNRALAQTLRGGGLAGNNDGESTARPNRETNDGKKWLPDALERFLNR